MKPGREDQGLRRATVLLVRPRRAFALDLLVGALARRVDFADGRERGLLQGAVSGLALQSSRRGIAPSILARRGPFEAERSAGTLLVENGRTWPANAGRVPFWQFCQFVVRAFSIFQRASEAWGVRLRQAGPAGRPG
jgi:hypothetical protein